MDYAVRMCSGPGFRQELWLWIGEGSIISSGAWPGMIVGDLFAEATVLPWWIVSFGSLDSGLCLESFGLVLWLDDGGLGGIVILMFCLSGFGK